MRARVHQFLTAGLVPRTTTLGVLASLMAIAPLGVSTPAAQAATGTITEFNNANRPGIIQNPSSDPLGLAVGPDGNLWFTDAGENLQATGGAAAPPKQIGRFHLADGSLSFNPATDWFPNGEPGSPTDVAGGEESKHKRHERRERESHHDRVNRHLFRPRSAESEETKKRARRASD